MSQQVPGWEGSVGPFPPDYPNPHVYARDVHSGAGNCVYGAASTDRIHVDAGLRIALSRAVDALEMARRAYEEIWAIDWGQVDRAINVGRSALAHGGEAEAG